MDLWHLSSTVDELYDATRLFDLFLNLESAEIFTRQRIFRERWHRNSPLAARKGWVAPKDAVFIWIWTVALTHSKAIGHSACLATVHLGKHKLEGACQHSNLGPPRQWQVSSSTSLIKDLIFRSDGVWLAVSRLDRGLQAYHSIMWRWLTIFHIDPEHVTWNSCWKKVLSWLQEVGLFLCQRYTLESNWT